MLRVTGEHLDVEQMLDGVPMVPNRIWKKGEPRFKNAPHKRLLAKSGASFVVSSAEMNDLAAQIKDAAGYIVRNEAHIKRMVRFPGIEEATIDFGIELRDVPIHSDYLSPELIVAAANVGVGIELSHYPVGAED